MFALTQPSIGTPVLWISFIIFILILLAIDIGVFHRRPHALKFKEALTWSAVWISLALLFNLGIFYFFGSKPALEFLTGYLIEEALSVDNLFVFLVIFSYFCVPTQLQHRVLFWGIVGAQVMRGVFILLGATLIASFHWIIYVFGVFLILTGIKLFRQKTNEFCPEKNIVVRLYKRFIPAVSEYRDTHFFVKEDGKRKATLLFLVLLVVEATDIVFAVDSIPAIFAITQDPFIVYTSNIFAILGLRSLYFLLAGMMEKFHYLKVGLSFVLVFVGIKMLLADMYKIPIGISLAVVVLLLGGSVLISFLRPPVEKHSA